MTAKKAAKVQKCKSNVGRWLKKAAEKYLPARRAKRT
jgi:hypothetical protein